MLFLHLSDIHFKDGDIDRSTDPNMGLRDDLIEDVRKMTEQIGKPIDAILISGDIAFAGRESEYNFALRWLKDHLCPASGCNFNNIIVIPGNHDVNRGAANAPMHKLARGALRETPIHQSNAKITEFVNSATSSDMLYAPIEYYNRFAANFLCEIGFENPTVGSKPYVVRDFELNDQSTIRIWGFNSVLVCDADDDEKLMFIDPSAAQVVAREEGVVHMVMSHHPFNWLRNGAEFRERAEGVAKIHLFGHEHTLRVERDVNYSRVRAGAVQPDRDEPGWKPGYNYIDVSVNGQGNDRMLKIKIWVRQREQARYIAVPDPDDNPTWDAAHKLPAWRVPKSEPMKTAVINGGEQAQQAEDAGVVTQSPTVRSVVPKLLGLPETDQQKIIVDLRLNADGDRQLKDYEAALVAVRRAAERGQLAELELSIDEFNRSRGSRK